MSSSKDRFTDVELENKRLPACYGYITWKLLPLEKAMEDLQSVLPEINRFVKLAKRHCIHPDKYNLTKDEAAAVYLYTMEMSEDACVYRILNQTLRVEDRSTVRPWFAYLRLLDSATSKLPKYKGTIWRGVNKDVTAKFKRGDKITWWSVTSCSKSIDVISSFLDKSPQSTLFNIESSAGKVIAAYTCYPAEDEVILMPGTTFEVVADPLHHHGGLHFIHLKEIPDDDNEDDDDDADANTKPQASAPATVSVTKKMSTISLDPYPSTYSASSASAVPKGSAVSPKPPPPPPPQPAAKPKQSQYKEFAGPGECKELYCKGRPCAKCHKCRDWQFTGDRGTWDWIANYKNWKDKDWERWRRDRVWNNFTKRDGATCGFGLGLYHYYGDYDDGYYCLCDNNVRN